MSYHYRMLEHNYAVRLSDQIEDMIENGELDPDDADDYYYEKMDDFKWGYADYMYDNYKDREWDD